MDKKFWIQIIVLSAVIFAGVYITKNSKIVDQFLGAQRTAQPIRINIKEVTLNVELADTPDKRSKGLSGRVSLASDSAMLFVYDKPQKYTFWMKGMKFPLDFIWINGEKVAELLENVPPADPNQADQLLPRYQPSIEVDKILEVNAGFIKAHNINIGDKLYIVTN